MNPMTAPVTSAFPDGPTTWRASDGDHDRLRVLLEVASRLEPSDASAGAWLRDAARDELGTLIAAGVLPLHLAVAEDEPPVVVVRTVVAAWCHLGGTRRPGAQVG